MVNLNSLTGHYYVNAVIRMGLGKIRQLGWWREDWQVGSKHAHTTHVSMTYMCMQCILRPSAYIPMNILHGHVSESTVGDSSCTCAQFWHGYAASLAAVVVTRITHQLKQHANKHKSYSKHSNMPFNMPRKDQECIHCTAANVNITFIRVQHEYIIENKNVWL